MLCWNQFLIFCPILLPSCSTRDGAIVIQEVTSRFSTTFELEEVITEVLLGLSNNSSVRFFPVTHQFTQVAGSTLVSYHKSFCHKEFY